MTTDSPTSTTFHEHPQEVAVELRDWLRDLLAGLADQPAEARDGLIAGLPLGARAELFSHGIISDSDVTPGDGKDVLTPFGQEVMQACTGLVNEHGTSEEFEAEVEAARSWASTKSDALREAGHTPPHERRAAQDS